MSAQTSANSTRVLSEFEVATIKPSQISGNGPIVRPLLDGILATDCTPQMLVAFAYGLYSRGYGEKHVLGIPAWAESDRFDVLAKMNTADAEDLRKLDANQREIKLQSMLRALLSSRLKVQTHQEVHEVPALALVRAKGGSKMREGEPDDPALPNGTLRITRGKITGAGVEITRLADALRRQVNQPVIDRTELTETYTFVLEWQPEEESPSGDQGSVSPLSASSLFSALQQQLGLRLTPASTHVDIVVVDHIEKPSAN